MAPLHELMKSSGFQECTTMQNETILVTVTAEDIKNGRRRNIHLCANALALQRATGCSDAWIGPFVACVTGGHAGTHQTPPAVEAFITRFDNGEPVEPYTFVLIPR